MSTKGPLTVPEEQYDSFVLDSDCELLHKYGCGIIGTCVCMLEMKDKEVDSRIKRKEVGDG